MVGFLHFTVVIKRAEVVSASKLLWGGRLDEFFKGVFDDIDDVGVVSNIGVVAGFFSGENGGNPDVGHGVFESKYTDTSEIFVAQRNLVRLFG